MFRSQSRKRRFGFTLVEVLVTTVVIGVLAAVVLPALAKQTSAADPARVASDLNNIKMGIEVFSQNLRPDYPGDLEDLVNAPVDDASTSPSSSNDDFAVDGLFYANTSTWNGPYVAQSLSSDTAGVGNTTWRAGAAGFYENDLKICDITASNPCAEVTSGDGAFVTIQLNDLTITEADGIDVMMDGSPANSTTGLFRYSVSTTATGFYYTIPYSP
jgi:prepilin-type N-terminal cleavage/methylation domain-containing protein